MTEKITKTFTITANEEMMGDIERFLACLHLFTNWGHSSILALSQDGDGHDLVKVEGEDFNPSKYRVYADYISRFRPKERKVEIVDASLKSTDYISRFRPKERKVEIVDESLKSKNYIAYRDGEWEEKYGHLYENEPQPWKEN